MRCDVLIVDAANVIGARPDGWWRDRAGAAERLMAGLAPLAPELAEDVIVVLEGAASGADVRAGGGALRVVRAPGSGDDAIIDLVGQQPTAAAVVVVTSDRALRARAEALGAAVEGASWLRDRLDMADQR